jgi:hypothetical protein
MKNPKVQYTPEDNQNLLALLMKIESYDYDEENVIVKNVLEDHIKYPHKHQAYDMIACEAYCFEQKAKNLRKTTKAFKCPLDQVGLLINDENEAIRIIAKWRLEHNK